MNSPSFAGLFSDDEARQNVAQLQQQTQAMDARLVKLENAINSNTLVDVLSQLDGLKTDMSQMRGQLEVLSHDLETTQKRQKDLYVDLDTRLRRLEGGSSAASPAPTDTPDAKDAPKAGAPKLTEAVTSDPEAENRAYEAALSQFKIGNYTGAVTGFQNFVDTYPKSSLAPSAQYWVGNSYFSLRDFKNAIASQQKLISLYPKHQKVPDAMLNIATSYQGMGDAAAAKKTLEELAAKFPLSNAGELAKKRLGAH
ncbi:MAG: tol-pal system protein YbgF [Burkholderiales bacterium]